MERDLARWSEGAARLDERGAAAEREEARGVERREDGRVGEDLRVLPR